MIGRTLFWYIFGDLMKIFLMANGALAGIMSFGGLLRPLTHQGLDVGQIGKLLGYFNMAMLTYSMPIAALFATTVVYGRLSADNEVTACRAGGLSHLTVALPAFVMGVFVAILSLVFLCFIVPTFTLRIEQTLYSNMAKLIAGKIQGTHQIRFGPVTIFAQEAYIPPAGDRRGRQTVVLKGPTIETVVRPYKDQRDYRIPKDFYTASEAILYIDQRGRGEQRGTAKVYITIRLENGLKFPREFAGAMQAGVDATVYGPIEVDSPIKEETKFMDVWRLKRLYHDPGEGAKVKKVVDDIVERDQQSLYAMQLAQRLNAANEAVFQFDRDETYVLSREAGAPPAVWQGSEVAFHPAMPVDVFSAWTGLQASADAACMTAGVPPLPALPPCNSSAFRPIRFQRLIPGQQTPTVAAREAHVLVRPSGDPNTLRLSFELIDDVTLTGSGPVERKNYIVPFTVPIAGRVAEIARRDVDYYTGNSAPGVDRVRVGRELLQLHNEILAESNSRVSFAISCLVLVMVGCALGLMFRSGNFLSAFALSFIPALVTITLIVAGQRISGNIPDTLKVEFRQYANTPLQLGMGLIWAGNCLNFVLAVVLLGRLQRK